MKGFGVAPRKGTKAYDQEYVYAYYGIHIHTGEVQSVYQRRDGVLSGPSGTHYGHKGSRAETEILLAFHLTDVRMLPIHLVDSHSARLIEELKELSKTKAAAKSAEAKQD